MRKVFVLCLLLLTLIPQMDLNAQERPDFLLGTWEFYRNFNEKGEELTLYMPMLRMDFLKDGNFRIEFKNNLLTGSYKVQNDNELVLYDAILDGEPQPQTEIMTFQKDTETQITFVIPQEAYTLYAVYIKD